MLRDNGDLVPMSAAAPAGAVSRPGKSRGAGAPRSGSPRDGSMPSTVGHDLFDTIATMGHEQVVMCHDPSCGYRGIIAIHSTTLGPALGGTRFWQYASSNEAIVDADRKSTRLNSSHSQI